MRDSVSEVIVNESLLRKLNINDPEEALGRNILFDNSAISGTIVGVVKDFHHQSLQNEIEPVAIYPMHRVYNRMGIKLNSSVNENTISNIEAVWKENFPNDVFQYSDLNLH